MAEEVKIDKQVFHNRLSNFISAWKADKRANDALFGGVGSIVIHMGKNEDTVTFQKNNAMHVCSFRRLVYGAYSLLTQVMTDLATWLRIPSYFIIIYDRNTLYRYHS